jgi:hypothetical protein
MSGHTPVCEDEAKVKPRSPPKRGSLAKPGVVGGVWMWFELHGRLNSVPVIAVPNPEAINMRASVTPR